MLGSVLLSSLNILGSNFNDTWVNNESCSIKVSSPVDELIFVHCGHASNKNNNSVHVSIVMGNIYRTGLLQAGWLWQTALSL